MPTDTSGYARRVLYHPDGEAIDRTDDNNEQEFARLNLHNLIMSGSQANGYGEPFGAQLAGPPESFDSLNALGFTYGDAVMVPWPGAAYVYATGVARQLTFSPGPIALVCDEPWSAAPEEYAFYRIPFNLTLTTAAGDATNPRIDLVEVKLDYIDGDPQTRHFEDAVTRAPSSQAGTNKERQVRFTYQIKQGTPAANPVYPTPTAGFVAMAAVWVPATHNAVHDPNNIRDLRAPFGARVYDVDPKAMHYTGVNPWFLQGMQAFSHVDSIDTDRVIVPCPIGSRSARLLAVGVCGSPGDDAVVELVRLDHPLSSGGPTSTYIATITDDVWNADGFTWIDAIRIADYVGQNSTASYKGTRAASSRAGAPLWCNGKTGGMAHFGGLPADAPAIESRLALSIGCAGSNVTGPGGRLSFVRFVIAEGL